MRGTEKVRCRLSTFYNDGLQSGKESLFPLLIEVEASAAPLVAEARTPKKRHFKRRVYVGMHMGAYLYISMASRRCSPLVWVNTPNTKHMGLVLDAWCWALGELLNLSQ